MRENLARGGLRPDPVKLTSLASGRTTGPPVSAARPPAFGPTLALTLTLALAAVGALVALMVLVVEPRPILGLGSAQRQHAETGVYLAAFAIVLPLSVLGGPRLARRVESGPNAGGLSPLAALMVAGLATALLTARAADALWGGGPELLLAGLLAWTAVAAAALARATRPVPVRWLLGLAARERELWLLAVVLAIATPLVVIHPDSLSPLPVGLTAIAVPLLLLAARRGWLPGLGGRVGIGVDVALVVLLCLLIPDLVIIRPEDPALAPLDRFITSIMKFHHDFLVGPANQVLGGDTLLRDTASQYGVGSIYLLAGWFELTTVSYGTFGLLDGLLTALLFAAASAVLRMGGCSRPLAGSVMGIAVIALVFNRIYPVGALPQEGPFRFGLPMGVIAALVAGARWPHRTAAARAGALLVVAVSSIWALEAFAFSAGTFAAIVCVEAYALEGGGRMRRLVSQAGLMALAVLAAHVLFAAATWIASGDPPGWGQYLAFLHAFLFGGLGELTYDFSRWSVGLAVGAAYLASAATLLVVMRTRPALVRESRACFTALAGVTGYGVALFAYLVDRSAEHVVVYVSLPALMAGALWLGVLLRSPAVAPPAVRKGALAAGLALGVLLTSVAWSSIATPLEHSALAHVLPGGSSTRAALARLRAFPAIDSRSPEGERLLNRHMPGERKSVVLVEPDLTVEILLRRGRANALPLSDPREDDFTPDQRLPGLLDAVADLRPGRRLLVDGPALAALTAVRRDPRSLLLRLPGARTAGLEVQALTALDRRFRFRVVERGAGGLVVLELERRGV